MVWFNGVSCFDFLYVATGKKMMFSVILQYYETFLNFLNFFDKKIKFNVVAIFRVNRYGNFMMGPVPLLNHFFFIQTPISFFWVVCLHFYRWMDSFNL